MNNLNITGRCGSDAELRTTTKGTQLINFSMAVDVGWGDNKTTMWWRVTKFGKGVENLAQFIKKGGMIGVSGEPSVREYEKDGVMKYSLEVNANSVTLLGGGKPAESQGTPRDGIIPANAAPAGTANSFTDLESDQIPF
jgi:single-strand DNA-binding protein